MVGRGGQLTGIMLIFSAYKKIYLIIKNNYTESKNSIPDFIKIDTEGFEINVIRGAKKMLQKKPNIITFECVYDEEKRLLFEEFESINYQVHELQNISHKSLTKDDFIKSKYANFLAIHSEHPALKSDLFRS